MSLILNSFLSTSGDEAITNGHSETGCGDSKCETTQDASSENATVGEAGDAATAPSSGDRTLATEQDIILIQDDGFLIKIVAPGVEAFNLPVSLHLLVT